MVLAFRWITGPYYLPFSQKRGSRDPIIFHIFRNEKKSQEGGYWCVETYVFASSENPEMTMFLHTHIPPLEIFFISQKSEK